MSDFKTNFFRNEYDYEEDAYDKLNNIYKKTKKNKIYTNKSTKKKFEYDYEEDPYEP